MNTIAYETKAQRATDHAVMRALVEGKDGHPSCLLSGDYFDECRCYCEQEAAPEPMRTIHLTPYISVQGPGMTRAEAWRLVFGEKRE